MVIERRPIHINLTRGSHAELKKICATENVTMQEIIEYFVNGVVDEREDMVKILKEVSRLKRERKLNRIAKVENDEIFEKILHGAERR